MGVDMFNASTIEYYVMTNVVNMVSNGNLIFNSYMGDDHNSGRHQCKHETRGDSLVNKSQATPIEESLVNKSHEKPTAVLL